jgi:hypothetical protein
MSEVSNALETAQEYIFNRKSDKMHTDILCILYYTILALHVSGAICTHHQEHKLQSKALGTCDLWMREVLAIKWF